MSNDKAQASYHPNTVQNPNLVGDWTPRVQSSPNTATDEWASHSARGSYGGIDTGLAPRYRELNIAYILLIFFGFLGVHRFYLKSGLAWVWLFTLGLFGVGVFVDIFILKSVWENANSKIAREYQLRSGR